MPPGTLGVQLCLNIQFVQYYMGILYFLDYFLTPITSATVISVHAKAHYGRAKITQWWECSPPRKWGLGSNTGIDTITWVALCSLHWNIIFSRLFNTYYFCNSYFCTCKSALFAPRDFSPGALVFPSGFPFSLLSQHFQIPIQPGMADKEPKCGCATSKSLFI